VAVWACHLESPFCMFVSLLGLQYDGLATQRHGNLVFSNTLSIAKKEWAHGVMRRQNLRSDSCIDQGSLRIIEG
jgi:hypothetical protein